MKLQWASLRQGVVDTANQLQEQAKEKITQAKTGVEEVDWHKVGADLQEAGVQAKDLGDSALRRTRSFVDEAAQAWKAHGATDAAAAGAALEQVASAPNSVEAQGILKNMPPADMQSGLHNLAGRWQAEHGPEGAGERLKVLDGVLEAAITVGEDHNLRARSVPRHQGRPASIEATLLQAVGALRRSVAVVGDEIESRPWPDVYAMTSGASEGLWSAGEKIAKQAMKLKGSDDGAGVLSKARTQFSEAISSVSPKWLKSQYNSAAGAIREATEQAELVLDSLDGLEAKAGDRDAMFARFETVLGQAKNITDPKADAIGIGFLNEAAGLASGARGKELVYIRDTGQLRVVDLQMGGARLAVGASKRPFARSLYGDPDAISKTKTRNVGEVGAMIFHVGRGTSTGPDESQDAVKSWHGTLGVGFNASLPLIGDQSIYSVKEETLALHTLTPEQIARLEAQLDAVPEAARKWTSMIKGATI